MYSWICMLISSVVYIIFSSWTLSFDIPIVISALLNGIVYSLVFHFRLKSLKYLDSSTFFINYRILSSIFLMIVWMIFFSEMLSYKEYIGIFLWFVIFYLLMDKKYKWESDKKMWKWYSYLMVWVVWVGILQSISKNFALHDYDYSNYLFYSSIIWILSTYILRWKWDSIKKIMKIKSFKMFVFLLFSWIIFTLYTLTAFLWMKFWWNMVVVYKIVSYWLFIPIILSIIIYKEKVTPKKVLAFILTILSIWLFF